MDKTEKYVFKINRNLHGSKDTAHTFFLHIWSKLLNLGHFQSAINEFIFFKGYTTFFTYVNDGIFLDVSNERIYLAVAELAKVCEIKDKGQIND